MFKFVIVWSSGMKMIVYGPSLEFVAERFETAQFIYRVSESWWDRV